MRAKPRGVLSNKSESGGEAPLRRDATNFCQILTNVVTISFMAVVALFFILLFFEVGTDKGWVDRQERRIDHMTWMGSHVAHVYNRTADFVVQTRGYHTNFTQVADDVMWKDAHHLSKSINKVTETWWSALHILRRFDELEFLEKLTHFAGFTMEQTTSREGQSILRGVGFMFDALVEGPEGEAWQRLNGSYHALMRTNPKLVRIVDLACDSMIESLESGAFDEIVKATPHFIGNVTSFMAEANERDMLEKADHMFEDVDRVSYFLFQIMGRLSAPQSNDDGAPPAPELRH